MVFIDFHKNFIGLTGSFDEIKEVCKKFRVYFSLPPNINENNLNNGEYLVDHSIFFYLMGPNMEFIDCYSKEKDSSYAFNSIKSHILQQ